MSTPSPAEVAVGSFGLMFALIGIDDPAVAWLQENGVRVGLVGVAASFVAFVVCLISPASSARLFVGRILAGGVLGAAATAAAGSIHASGAGAAATAGIIIFLGVGGWIFLDALRQYLEAKRNSGELVGWLGTVMERIVSKGQTTQKGPTDAAGPTTTTIIGPLTVDRRFDAGGNASQPEQRLRDEQKAGGPASASSHGNRAIESRGEQEVSNKTPGT